MSMCISRMGRPEGACGLMCQMGHNLVSIQPTSQAASKVILLWPSRTQHDVVLTKMGLGTHMPCIPGRACTTEGQALAVAATFCTDASRCLECWIMAS